MPEQEALDIVLRNVSGYLVAARETAISGASAFDRIYILPTSHGPPPPPPHRLRRQQAVQVQDDSDDDAPLPNGPRGPNTPPGARLPRDVESADQHRETTGDGG